MWAECVSIAVFSCVGAIGEGGEACILVSKGPRENRTEENIISNHGRADRRVAFSSACTEARKIRVVEGKKRKRKCWNMTFVDQDNKVIFLPALFFWFRPRRVILSLGRSIIYFDQGRNLAIKAFETHSKQQVRLCSQSRNVSYRLFLVLILSSCFQMVILFFWIGQVSDATRRCRIYRKSFKSNWFEFSKNSICGSLSNSCTPPLN